MAWDTWNTLRALGLIGMFGWCVSVVCALFLARGQPLNIYHRKTLGAGLLLISAWAFTLLITMRSIGMVSRESLLPLSASLLSSGVFLLWSWLILSAKLSFRIVPKHKTVGNQQWTN